MKFTIVGAGAIGGTIGAYLARAGEDVQFVDSAAQHVQAIQQYGLTVRAVDETFTVPVNASLPTEITGPLDIVLLAVKAHFTEPAVAPIAPLLAPDGVVVSVQNGLCSPTISRYVGRERTMDAFVDFFADYIEPGLIHYGGPGTFRVGEIDGEITPRLREIVRHLSHWGDVRPTDNVAGYTWGKLGFANMLYATALADETMADVIERYPELMVELACEMFDVAAVQGTRLESFDNVEPALYYPRERQDWPALHTSIRRLVTWLRTQQKVKSGIWRDLAVRKRKTEVDADIGAVLRIAGLHGLSLPLSERLIGMIHELEDRRREMSWGNLDELEVLRISGPRSHDRQPGRTNR